MRVDPIGCRVPAPRSQRRETVTNWGLAPMPRGAFPPFATVFERRPGLHPHRFAFHRQLHAFPTMTIPHHLGPSAGVLVVGSCLGSFLNVCTYRLPRSISLFPPRSCCPSCRTPILARDNCPVLGWLFRRGKCRHCRSRISPRYPAVEL